MAWQTAQVLIGTSGYDYGHWRGGVFYPADLPRAEQLPFYATRFRTVELNRPFYRLPDVEHFARWEAQTPDDFVFAVKASRFISHVRRLRDCEEPVWTILERAAALGSKLGVILVQLPPFMRLDLPRLADFLRVLPAGPPWVLEFRHPSWLAAPVFELLDRHGAGYCVAVGGKANVEHVAATGPVAYLRMHAGQGKGGNFTPAQLRRWAEAVRRLRDRTVYVYFNNDPHGHAPRNARMLLDLLGVER